jgi:hypothetical protein
MKIHPVGAEFFSCGRTDRHEKLKVAFRNFAKAPKMIKIIPYKTEDN